MQNSKEFLSRLLDVLLPNRAAPVLARVEKAHEGAGKTKYAVDVKILKVGSLEETAQVIKDVPINPIWAGKKKRGVYAIPSEGQVVIIEFLCWNVAYPYVAGIWSDDYEADDFSKDTFIITDGEGMKFVIAANEKGITIDNGTGSIIKLEKDNKASVTNGKLECILNGDKLSVKNGSKNLFTVIDTHIQNIISMKTAGSPAQHVVSPDDIQKFAQDKSDLAAVLEA